MLKQRMLTALALALFLTGVIFLLPTVYFSLVLAAGIVLAAREWVRLSDLQKRWQDATFTLLTLAGMPALWWLHSVHPGLTHWVLLLAFFWWCLAILWLVSYSSRITVKTLPVGLRMVIGLLILLPCWLAMVMMHGHEQYGPAFVFFFLWVTSWADTGAYFMGRKFGRTKLAPVISPGKTWEGVAGGFIAVAVVVIAGSLLMQLSLTQFFWILLASLFVVPFCIVGDLTESLVKRQAQVKDSGQLLPGHGGMLDRIDSLTAAAPVFMLMLFYLESRF